MAYQPNSTRNTSGGKAKYTQAGGCCGNRAAKMLPYQMAVLGLLIWVARPVQNDLRALPERAATAPGSAKGWLAPRQILYDM